MGLGEPLARHRKDKICAVVQSALGEKVVSEVPAVMFFSTAHSTGSANQSVFFTSEKPPTVGTVGWVVLPSTRMVQFQLLSGVIIFTIVFAPYMSSRKSGLIFSSVTGETPPVSVRSQLP